MSSVGDRIRQGKVSETLLREYCRLMALKQNGGLPRELFKSFTKTMAGRTEDNLDKSDPQLKKVSDHD